AHLRKLLGWTGEPRTGTRSTPRRSHWPELEALEERTVLSTASHTHAALLHHGHHHQAQVPHVRPALQTTGGTTTGNTTQTTGSGSQATNTGTGSHQTTTPPTGGTTTTGTGSQATNTGSGSQATTTGSGSQATGSHATTTTTTTGGTGATGGT